MFGTRRLRPFDFLTTKLTVISLYKDALTTDHFKKCANAHKRHRENHITIRSMDGRCDHNATETAYTSNLSKAHVTHDSSGPATWAVVYRMQLNINAF